VLVDELAGKAARNEAFVSRQITWGHEWKRRLFNLGGVELMMSPWSWRKSNVFSCLSLFRFRHNERH
jgi:hypothetical protein